MKYLQIIAQTTSGGAGMLGTILMFSILGLIIYFIVKAFTKNKTNKESNSKLASTIWIMGILYMILTIIGGIVLINNAQEKTLGYFGYETKSNPVIIGLGVAEIISGVVIGLLCLGVAQIIEQNMSIQKSINNFKITQELKNLDNISTTIE